MNLCQHEKAVLYNTYAHIAYASTDLVDAFYGRLFEIDPNLQALFAGTIREHKVRWRLMLITMISTADQTADLNQCLRALGKRHADYGVKHEDYPKLVDAFMGALQQYLGDQFTPEMAVTWRKFLGFLIEYVDNPNEAEQG